MEEILLLNRPPLAGWASADAIPAVQAVYIVRVERILYIKLDYSLLPMNEYSNIRSTGSDYQIWPSSVE